MAPAAPMARAEGGTQSWQRGEGRGLCHTGVIVTHCNKAKRSHDVQNICGELVSGVRFLRGVVIRVSLVTGAYVLFVFRSVRRVTK